MWTKYFYAYKGILLKVNSLMCKIFKGVIGMKDKKNKKTSTNNQWSSCKASASSQCKKNHDEK